MQKQPEGGNEGKRRGCQQGALSLKLAGSIPPQKGKFRGVWERKFQLQKVGKEVQSPHHEMRRPSTGRGGNFPKITQQVSEPGLELWSPHSTFYFLLIQQELRIHVPTTSDRQQKCNKLVRCGDYRPALPNRNPRGDRFATLTFQVDTSSWTSHMSSAEGPRVASGYFTGWHS